MLTVNYSQHRHFWCHFFIMRNIKYSKEFIETVSKDSRVKYIDSSSVRFTLEFRQQLYDLIYPNLTVSNLRNAFDKLGFKFKLDSDCYCTMIKNFKKCRPKGAANAQIYQWNYQNKLKIDESYNEFLILTGLFKPSKNGIKPSTKLMRDINARYPEISVDDYLNSIGIDLNRFGYQRVYMIERKLKNSDTDRDSFLPEDICYLTNHPYVKKITSNRITFIDNFFSEAQLFKKLPINEILNIFEIGSSRINYNVKNNIKFEINIYKQTKSEQIKRNTKLLLKIEQNKLNALSTMFVKDMNEIKDNIHSLSCSQKKEICKYIRVILNDKNCTYSLNELLKMIGISRSSYYSILKNKNYAKYEKDKTLRDLKDKITIESVINSNKYPKGNRMIYMLLRRIGKPMSRNKIYRLCRKFNITCSVRKHNKCRQAMNALLERNVKDNLLKRKFKLSKPNQITLTDVSYLKCSFGTVYLSALKDACSGRIKLIVSKYNDLELVLNTLDLLNKNNYGIKLFHSDQGALYLNDSFQNKLKELGYTQSMSKRGNCWDNAPQESFFGHMKDEVDFKKLDSYESVIKEIEEYEHYYNYDRPQWNRCMMTPIEFESYINSLDKVKYKEYYDKELDKYNKMMENAKILAVKRAKNMGIVINL